MAKRELAKTSSAAKAAGKVQAVKEWLDMNYELRLIYSTTQNRILRVRNVNTLHQSQKMISICI